MTNKLTIKMSSKCTEFHCQSHFRQPVLTRFDIKFRNDRSINISKNNVTFFNMKIHQDAESCDKNNENQINKVFLQGFYLQ